MLREIFFLHDFFLCGSLRCLFCYSFYQLQLWTVCGRVMAYFRENKRLMPFLLYVDMLTVRRKLFFAYFIESERHGILILTVFRVFRNILFVHGSRSVTSPLLFALDQDS